MAGQDNGMGIVDTSRARAKAAVSAAEANVTEIQAELKQAQALQEGSAAANELLGSLSGVAFIGGLADALREDMTVDRAKLNAEIDRITAELRAAESKLNMALKTQAALLAVVGPDPADAYAGSR